MTYQVLARKWRPKVFDSVIGQEHIVTAIANSFILNKVHHAYILFGTRGVGKTTIARLFAKRLNCKSEKKSLPCGCCNICLEIDKGCFFDVIEIDAASRSKVEDTREFLDDSYYPPIVGQFKVYLIDEVHMLSRNSLNALLKVLEEPPKHVKFFLITTEQQKLPATILSRCVQFYLRPLSISQIFNQLVYIFKQENIECELSGVKLIAYFAKGSMRDALSLSEQAIIIGKNKIYHNVIKKMLGVIDIEHPLFLLESLIDDNVHAVMLRIEQCSKLNVDWDYFLSDMLMLLQKIGMIQLSNNTYDTHNDNVDDIRTFEKTRLIALSKKIVPAHVQLYYQIFLTGRKELYYAPSYRMGFEMIMLRASILLDIAKNHNSHNYICSDNSEKNSFITNMIANQGSFITFR
ncbi:DNA polymerase III subunit gamma/tau [Blochmannia endosymbiont of Polyrhachis (Hedomyrma) turneri]|uniref:DNA polymerase III subunit gamma/tau n=1 Tax=Blochmannia endosymbiont of Polyrhachis (Hedomyrma) turneri TaxID=1505596 RepID=UPI00061A6FBF|nr:DNA polymerase III subunit gamma/tau [Blochmannia endosymbiont of Polyrhachis (Hedomyrma) turneri]AKC59872.1 DNA polymerase III subunit tau [Blochmannia endosymbiont of Polyrhachis (Hedomyrma) turneri]